MTDDPSPEQVEQDGPSMNRRRLLAALGTGALTQGLAGCFFLGSDTRTFVAIMVRIALDPGAALEYLLLDFRRRTRTFEETIAGNDVTIEVTFNLLVYQLMQGLFGFGILVVPQPDIAGISLFGIADKSIPEIVEDPEQRTQIVNQLELTDAPVEAVEDPRLLDQRQVEGSDVYQSEVNVYRYVADLRTADDGEGDEGQDVLLFELGKGTGVEGMTDSADKIHTGISRSGVLAASDAPVVGEEEGSAFTPGQVERMTGAHETIIGNLEETSPDQLTTRTTVQDRGDEDDDDMTTEESSIEAALSLSQEAEGPFLADGRDGTTVTIEATDAEGNAIEQDDLHVALFTGDDMFRLPSIQSRGPGEYAVSVSSEVKGTATLRAEVEEFELREHQPVEFVPGPPDHFWITSNEPPGPEGPEPTASFNLLLKDQYGNLVPPDRAQYGFRSENSAATFSQQIDRERELVHVEVGLDEPPAPDGEFWSAFEVEVFEENSGHSRETRVEFPVVDTSFRPVRVDGEDAYALELSSVNFAPLQVFDIFVPFDEERFEILETRPGEVEAEVERTSDGVRIRGEALDDEGGGDGDGDDEEVKTALVVLIFRMHQDLGLREIDVDVLRMLFRGYDESVFSLRFLGKLLMTEFTEVCLKIWMVEGCDEEKIDSDIQTLRNVFNRSYLNCCPAVIWNIDRMSIPENNNDASEMDWDQADSAWPNDHLTPGSGEDNSGDVPVPDLSNEQERLVENFNDPDCINVYYVPDLDFGTIGQGGTELSETDDKWSFDTNGQRDTNWAFVSNEAGGKTLPHEIGHVFNLKHPPKPENDDDVPESNVMLQTAEDADPGRFSEDQCERLQDIMD